MKNRLTIIAFIISAYLMIISCATVKSPLIAASSKGDSATVQKLVSEGANINEVDSSGTTPLIYAIWSGNIDVVKTLLSLGANVNQKDTSGSSPIYHATYYGYPNIAKLLYLSNRATGKGGTQELKKVCKEFQEDTIITSKGRPLYEAYLNYRYLYPKIRYQGNKKIAIIVCDKRPYVLSNEKASEYVGLWRERGLMRPYVYDIGTLSQKPLSDDFTYCISEALSDAGFSIINNFNQAQANLSYKKAEATSVDKIIYLAINEWITDTYDATGLYYNVNIKIFDGKNVLLVTKDTKGEDNLGGSGGMTTRFIYESVSAATENILSKMLNATDIQSALRD